MKNLGHQLEELAILRITWECFQYDIWSLQSTNHIYSTKTVPWSFILSQDGLVAKSKYLLDKAMAL